MNEVDALNDLVGQIDTVLAMPAPPLSDNCEECGLKLRPNQRKNGLCKSCLKDQKAMDRSEAGY